MPGAPRGLGTARSRRAVRDAQPPWPGAPSSRGAQGSARGDPAAAGDARKGLGAAGQQARRGCGCRGRGAWPREGRDSGPRGPRVLHAPPPGWGGKGGGLRRPRGDPGTGDPLPLGYPRLGLLGRTLGPHLRPQRRASVGFPGVPGARSSREPSRLLRWGSRSHLAGRLPKPASRGVPRTAACQWPG